MKKALVLISMIGLGFVLAWLTSDDSSQLKAELESLETKVQQFKTAIGKAEIERDTLKVRIALAEKNRDELQEQVDELTESRGELQKQAEEFSFSREQSQQQLAEIIGTRDKLNKQLTELTTSRNQLRKQVDELTWSRDAAVADAQVAQKRIVKLVVLLDEETEKFSELQNELIVINQAAENTQTPIIEVARRPVLHSFDSNRPRIMPGQTSTLSWQVSNAARIRIEPEVGPVTALGSRNVKPSTTTTYTLIAANKAGESRQTCRVKVDEAPTVQSQVIKQPAALTELVEPVVISSEVSEPPVVSSELIEPVVISSKAGERPTCHSFNTNRPVIMPGQTSTLSWQVSNAGRIRIEPEVGPVTALGSRTVKPSEATTYTLIAANKAGESRQSLRVDVGEQPAAVTEVVESPVVSSQAVEPPVISSKAGERPTCHSFNTNRPVIMPGQTSTLSWQVSNAQRIRIEPEVGPVSALGARTVKPSATTTYTLIATNQAGERRLSRRIEISERINIFSSDSIGSRVLLEEYKASDDSKVLSEQKPPVSDPNTALGKFLGYRALKDESGKFIFIPVYENKQEE